MFVYDSYVNTHTHELLHNDHVHSDCIFNRWSFICLFDRLGNAFKPYGLFEITHHTFQTFFFIFSFVDMAQPNMNMNINTISYTSFSHSLSLECKLIISRHTHKYDPNWGCCYFHAKWDHVSYISMINK